MATLSSSVISSGFSIFSLFSPLKPIKLEFISRGIKMCLLTPTGWLHFDGMYNSNLHFRANLCSNPNFFATLEYKTSKEMIGANFVDEGQMS